MDRKGPCMGQLFILPAGPSVKPLSAPSKPPTQSCTRLECHHPPDPSIHLFLQTPAAHCWGALWQLWTCREVSFTGWGAAMSDCMWFGFSLELHRGKLKEPSKMFGLVILLLEVSPCLRQMAKPVSSLQVQKNQARTLETLSRHLTSLSGLCPDWLCANNPVWASPRAHAAILSRAQLSSAAPS